jgi:hypothetical protein
MVIMQEMVPSLFNYDPFTLVFADTEEELKALKAEATANNKLTLIPVRRDE